MKTAAKLFSGHLTPNLDTSVVEAYKGNLQIIRSMVAREGDPYGILSFLQETIDSMRTDFYRKEVGPEFYAAIAEVVEALEKLPSE